MTVCVKCTAAYERTETKCPICGYVPEPAGRSLPKQVDGDLAELLPEVLERMRGDIKKSDEMPWIPSGIDHVAQLAIRKRHHEKMDEQRLLREAMALWGGGRGGKRIGRERESQREFYLRFGVDVWSAMTLNATNARELREKVEKDT